MKIEMTDAWCEAHGLCAGVDAELFPLDDEGYSAVGDGRAVPAGKEEVAGRGVSACPVRALRTIS
ncbi:ferredoxin [Actinomadura rugatobispora]|uniref:Ferredoxin n=1 Tax=Actinomadura rugatobispora TaxID=1994 RepID=A0ABW0ZYM9_9ACTN|nr:hypothetical protein GCM10010200_090280 [Actinomadura rugatobispora]